MKRFRCRIYVGPALVDAIADKVQAYCPEVDVLAGTEHIHITVEVEDNSNLAVSNAALQVFTNSNLYKPYRHSVEILREETK